ncbi:hypothetical protein Hypma_006274 [Hypsizygus marmoreus]|uniref:Uncharacterized protein n=1 Tax=Hypsizygus marmoreus TaxID=39966 RepID=A0A369K2I3_HYPMA|nr:hypothetical protein Hypma_006274 [Hypsizygus marmoreus]
MLVNLEALWTLFVVILWAGAAYGEQVPFTRISDSSQGKDVTAGVDLDLDGWDLDIGPPANSTDNLVFDTVSSLLQHWPNTRYRNGHTLVPGTIPPGTLLYHGTSTPHIPSVPEWLATDPEHSYLFCRTFVRNSTADGCWHLTLSTTRTLRILYFDGSSAAKMGGGPMDSQDVLLWGRVREESGLTVILIYKHPVARDKA